uniref:Uncharacterized protein n=1 Tax=Arundo donax TaxID=35708 RepID=A0A0A8Z0M4_ARUDO
MHVLFHSSVDFYRNETI